MSNQKSYFLYLSIVTAIAFGIYLLVRNHLPPHAFYIVPVFFAITGGSHFLLMMSLEKRPGQFTQYFMSAMGFKMLSYLLFLGIMYYVFGGITLPFVMAFFVAYFIYTIFEMIYLNTVVKRNRDAKHNARQKKDAPEK